MKNIFSYVNAKQDLFITELMEWLRIPSISTSFSDDNRSGLDAAAEFLIQKMKNLNLQNVKKYPTVGNAIVYGEKIVDVNLPTILIYGHYDVQPPEPLDKWDSPPFEPCIRNNKIYARGACDNKGQAYTHLIALESYQNTSTPLPCNLKFIFEGEEEIGSPHLVPFLEENKTMLKNDVVLVSDTAMVGEDSPSIVVGLRGICYIEVRCDGTNRDLHSGVYGGSVTNPVMALSKILAKLINDKGKIAVTGFYDSVKDLDELEKLQLSKIPFNESSYKEELGAKHLSGEIGYTTHERVGVRPSLDINGIYGGYQGEGLKTIIPSYAGAKISARLVPEQDPKDISHKIQNFIEQIAPKDMKMTFKSYHSAFSYRTPINSKYLKAASMAMKHVFGKQPYYTYEGGSIPIVAEFKRILDVDTILMGYGLNTDAIHAPNEHFAINNFVRGICCSAVFWNEVGKV